MLKCLQAAASALPSAALALALVGLAVGFAAPAAASCDINVRVINTGDHPITIQIASAQARSAPVHAAIFGPWRPMRNGGWFADRNRIRIEPGQQTQDIYRGQLCSQLPYTHQFRLTYTCRDGPRQGWSEQATRGISVIDIGYRCNLPP